MLKIGCFHAHYSNIEHIERALALYDVELIHYVDPGLDRMKIDVDFSQETIHKKVHESLDWIVRSHVDAILITCTFFTAALKEEHLYPVPIIRIDSPLFQKVCETDQPKIFVFTNPNTVKGTMDQLNKYALRNEKEIQVETKVIENSFELIMAGRKEEYIALVSSGLRQIAVDNPDKLVIVAQLSMVPAAQEVQSELGVYIGNHLIALASHLQEVLYLELKPVV